MPTDKDSLLHCFGDFVLDEVTLQLRLSGAPVPIRTTPARLLLFLASHAPRVVSKAEILQAVWPTVAVSDDALYSAVKDLRTALGDDARAPRFVESLRRRGYRLLPPVKGPARQAAEAGASLGDRRSLVVLPLLALSGRPDDEVLADGLCEALTSRLARSPGFSVIARTSAFTYKGRAVDVRTIGRELGVRYAVEGTVRRAGSRLRAALHLVETEHGKHLWAERWDRELGELFDLEDEIVESVAAQLRPAVVRSEARRAVEASPERVDARLL